MRFCLEIIAEGDGDVLGHFTEREYVDDGRGDVTLDVWMRERIEECARAHDLGSIELSTRDFDVLGYFDDAVDELRGAGDVYGVALVINGVAMSW